MKLFKILEGDRSVIVGYKWPLPEREGEPSEWTPPTGDVRVGESGYHLCKPLDIFQFPGPSLWLAEGRGASHSADGMVAFEQARLVRRVTRYTSLTLRSYALSCIKMALDEFNTSSIVWSMYTYLANGCNEPRLWESLIEKMQDEESGVRPTRERWIYSAQLAEYRLAHMLWFIEARAWNHAPPEDSHIYLIQGVIYTVTHMLTVMNTKNRPAAQYEISAEWKAAEERLASELERHLGVKRTEDGWEVCEE